MTITTEAQQKILFVGKERICRQIAYVLAIQNYAWASKLTKQNWEQYRDYQIYVCEYKSKRQQLIKLKNRTSEQLNIQYLDDICRTLDEEYATPRQTLPQVNRKEMRKNKMKHLRCLKPSALLLYVLKAKPNRNIQCTRLETHIGVGQKGDIRGCCSVDLPFGNLLRGGELNEIYNSIYARIIKLSSLNRSYCLCDLNRWCKGYCSQGRKKYRPTKTWQTPTSPQSIVLSFDKSCNLCCKSCRTEPYVLDQATQQAASAIVIKLLRSGYLEQTQTLSVASMGEAFYSPFYRQLLTTDLQRQQIEIVSNGTLFNEDNWQLLKGKYATIDVLISVDAATAETYRKLRGADFDNLMHNLTMLSDLHRKNQIRKFTLNCVIQRDNFREMPNFVRLGKKLGTTVINFQRLNNLGSFTAQEFLERCLIIDNQYLDYDLWCVLQDPIFNDPIVNLKKLQRYIDASEKRYRQRYEREQKQRRSV